MLKFRLIPHPLSLCAVALTVLLALPFAVNAQRCISHSSDQPLTELQFGSFFKSPVGPAGLEPTETLLKANGKSICLVGYMVKQEAPSIGRFFLTPLPLETHEHADGEADDLPASTVMVYLDESQKDLVIPHSTGLLAIQGLLTVGRREDQQGRISWIQLQLAPSEITPHAQGSASPVSTSHKH